MNLLELVADGLALVEERLLETDAERHETIDGAILHLIRSGGKRIRPAVALLVCRMLHAECQRAISLASAVEMLHTATLVHDDIIDGSLIRRGSPTLNANWSPGATILTGDYLFARAAEFASRTENVTVMRLFARALMTVCNGELHQMFNTQPLLIDRAAYYRRIYAKTAALFVLAAEASGVLAGTDAESQARLRTYGTELGIAFQVVDDLLDVVGSEVEVGKPLGSDLAQGLMTLPTICYLEQHPGDERILNVLDGQRGADSIRLALETIRESGVAAQVREEASRHAERAKVVLGDLPDNYYRQALIDLADFAVGRQS